jgi:S-DNA-T family DNA segregation ATPase FtsK/SpoIIIE
MPRRKKFKPIKLKIRTETIYTIVGLILVALGLLVMVSFTGQGMILTKINAFLIKLFGVSMLYLPFIFISAGLVMFQTKWAWSKPHVLLGTFIMMIGTMGAVKSGDAGAKSFTNLSQLVTPYGAMVIYVTLILIGILIMVQLSFTEIVELMAKLKPARKIKEDRGEVDEGELKKAKGFSIPKLSLGFNKKQPEFSVNDNSSQALAQAPAEGKAVMEAKPAQPVQDVTKEGELSQGTIQSPDTANIIWEYPPLSLLSSAQNGKADRGDVKQNAQTIEATLESFGIQARVSEVNYGPSVTQYALEITRGTKLSKITGLATDLALALAAPTGQIRIEAPIAGRSLVGIEVPNRSAQYVTLKTMLASDKMRKHKSKLAVALGINVAGEPVVADIASMPHVLIAGSTGSGKSVCINAFMCSMLYRSSPSEVKFILVDPKRVELTAYNNIPHLLTPVIVEPGKVVSALKWATVEMDRRYKQLAEVGVKNIAGYNELAGFVAMPNIVILIDELADIMLFAPSEVEECITRIAQMARAVGIHLVLATQRPSVDVLTGLIKANVPARIAFNVSSMMDSRVILDSPGAEKLLGRGDMLFVPPDQAKPSRVQGTYVADSEIKSLIDFIKSQGQKPDYEEDITTKYKASMVKGGSGGTAAGAEGRDDLFTESVKLISQYDKASSSLIQRRLSVGYARAARILDQLYESGLVGPAEGSKPRDINTTAVQQYLQSTQALES